MADFYDFDAARVSLATVNKIPLLTFESVAMSEFSLMIRRIFDMIVVLAFSPLIALILLILAAAIKLDSPGPVFFLQERVGLHKRRFKMIKLRTMVVDAEARMKEVEHLNEAKGPNFKIKDDPRITRVGGFLRKSSLDELPQLINVLRGQMSLVGPRPMSVRDVDLFDSAIQRKRFSARPGMTCLWQISGRSDLDFDDWLKLDLYYIDNWSIWLDLKILVKTIPCVLRGSGAA
jgi:exopolysaccharide biosynthesis polyprenyl glycosylphosphotransferase